MRRFFAFLRFAPKCAGPAAVQYMHRVTDKFTQADKREEHRMHNTLESAARGAQSRRMFPLTLRRQGAALAAGAAAGAGAVLYGVLAPFGPGLALGAAEDRFLAVCAGAALGVVLRYDGVQAVAMLSALAACAAVRWARPRRFGPACAACCGVWALAMLLMELSGAATPAQLLCTCIDALLCAGYGYALRRWPADEGGAGALLVGAVLVAGVVFSVGSTVPAVVMGTDVVFVLLAAFPSRQPARAATMSISTRTG